MAWRPVAPAVTSRRPFTSDKWPRVDGGEYPSAENKNTALTTSEVKTQVETLERPQRHGRLGDNDFSCSFCGDRNHRSGDCRMRLEKLLGQAARGLMRVESDHENFVFMKTTEILEKAKAKQAQKNTRKSSMQQQKTAQQTRQTHTGGLGARNLKTGE